MPFKDRRPPVSIDFGGHRERFLAARDRLVEEHLNLVRPIAESIFRRIPPSFDLDDLIAAGNLELLHLATRYRPREHGGAPFSAFARPRIRGAIFDSIRRRKWDEATRPSIDGVPEPSIDLSIEINTAIDERRLREKLADAVERLPACQRQVIEAYYAEKLPPARDRSSGQYIANRRVTATVGAALNLPEWRVEREHADAIAELRRRLKAS